MGPDQRKGSNALHFGSVLGVIVSMDSPYIADMRFQLHVLQCFL